MSQFYDQASLVMVPSGYKAGKVYSQKPLSTDGELTFTRNSNATRVNADGLVEKVRTNLLLQSNQFDTTWGLFSVSVTGGQSDKDGGTDAWLLEATGASGSLRQYNNTDGVISYSVYAKAGTVDWLRLRLDAATDANAWFDLSTGSVGSTDGSIDATITSAGGGWYRISLTANVSSLVDVRFYPATGDAVNGGTGDNVYIQDAQLETGDIATDYIATTSAAVSVGPTANVPRLDYSGGCPSLLLEPQRTNLLYASEDLTATYWNKYGGQTITGNDAISPDGYQNADKMVDAGGIYQQRAFSASTAYALSVFIKKDTATSFRLGFVDYQSAGYFGGDIRYTFATGAITVTQSLNSSVSGEAVDYGNGWIRLICKFTTNASQNYNYQFAEYDGGTGWSWGYQLEAGSYATSYIPTLGASVTRLADANCDILSLLSKGIISSATEWTVFFNVEGVTKAFYTSDGQFISGQDSTLDVYIRPANMDEQYARFYWRKDSKYIGSTFGKKIIARLSGGTGTTFVDGTLNGSSSVSGNYSLLGFTRNPNLAGVLKQMIIFPTALTDAQCIELTTL